MDRQQRAPTAAATRIKVFLGPPTVSYLVYLLLFITLLCQLVPFSPTMPHSGLDYSWMYGLNQALSQGLVFGRDIIFTFGPYASLYTGAYHPATAHLMMAGSILLGLAYWVALIVVLRDVRWYFQVALLIILAALMSSRDALLFWFPLLVGQALLGLPESRPLVRGNAAVAITAMLMAPFALLPLVKGDLFVLCAAVSGLIVIRLLMARAWSLALVVIATPTVLLPLLWTGAGQPLAALPDYFGNMLALIGGYGGAMARNGNTIHLVLYVATALLLLATIFRLRQLPMVQRGLIFLLYGLYLFLAFKAAFVRHDYHDRAAGIALLLGAVVLAGVYTSRSTILLLLLSLTTCLLIGTEYPGIYYSAYVGLKHRLADDRWPRDLFERRVKELADNSSIPRLAGSVDIYSYNQSLLIASGNTWDPRPVFQSYAAYTPALAAANRRHLSGSRSPDNVLFRVETIDGRLPSLEDGSSWPVLLTRYQPTRIKGGYLYLRKLPSKKIADLQLLHTDYYSLGETVPIDDSAAPVFVVVNLRPTLAGRLLQLLYKPSELKITLTLRNRRTRAYRFIAGMGRSEFLVSPLIENTSQFHLLFEDSRALADQAVASFSITSRAGAWEWKQPFAVTLESLPPGYAGGAETRAAKTQIITPGAAHSALHSPIR